MALQAEFVDWFEELFSVVPDTNIKKMFGGIGAFRQGVMYALALKDGRISLKADEETIAEFKAEGCEEWSHERKDGKRVYMGYWYIPERLTDDPDEMSTWAMKAWEVALRADAKKPPKQRKLIT